MGNSPSADQKAYFNLVGLTQLKSGGCPCLFGSREPVSTLTPEALKLLLMDLAKILTEIGVPDIDPAKKSIQDIVATLSSSMKDFNSIYGRLQGTPERFVATINKLKACINKHLPGYITGTTTAEISQQIANALDELLKMISAHFLSLDTQINTTNEKIATVIALLESLKDVDLNKLSQSGRVDFQRVLSTFLREFKILYEYLHKLISAFAPFKIQYTKLIGQSSDIETLARQMKAQAVTTDAKAAVAFMLAKWNVSYLLIEQLYEMLNILHISKEEYKKAANIEDIQRLVADKVLEHIPQTSEEFAKVLEAYNFLTTNNLIIPNESAVKGSAEIPMQEGSAELDYPNINTKATNLFLSASLTKLIAPFRNIAMAIKKLTERFIDTGISDTLTLKFIVSALESLPDITNNNIISILSAPTNISGIYDQDVFISVFTHIINQFKHLLTQKSITTATKSTLEEIISNLENIIATIRHISLQLTERRKAVGGASPQQQLMFDFDTTVINTMKLFKKTKAELIYALKFISFQSSFVQALDSLKYQATKYPEVLGRASAKTLDEQAKILKKHKEKIQELTTSIPQECTKQNAALLEQMTKYVELVIKTKTEFLQLVEAHELMMQKLETSMRESYNITNVTTLSDFLQLVEFIPVAMTDKTPMFLCRAFEIFPTFQLGWKRFYSNIDKWTSDNNLPYQAIVALACNLGGDAVEQVVAATGLPQAEVNKTFVAIKSDQLPGASEARLVGNPLLSVPIIDLGREKRSNLELLQSTLRSLWKMPALKNFIALFYMLIDKLDGSQSLKDGPMARKTMFRILSNYLVMSGYQMTADIPPITINNVFDENVVNGMVITTAGHASPYVDNNLAYGPFLTTTPPTGDEPVVNIRTPENVLRFSNLMLRPTGSLKGNEFIDMYEDTDQLLLRLIKSYATNILKAVFMHALKDSKFADQLNFASSFRRMIGAATPSLDEVELTPDFIEYVIRGSHIFESMKRFLKAFTPTAEYQIVCRPLPGSDLYKLHYQYEFRSETDDTYSEDVIQIIIHEFWVLRKKFPSMSLQEILNYIVVELNKSVLLVSKEYLDAEGKEVKNRLSSALITDTDREYELPHSVIDSSSLSSLSVLPSQSYMKESNWASVLNQKREKRRPNLSLTEYESIMLPYLDRYYQSVANMNNEITSISTSLSSYLSTYIDDIANAPKPEKIRILMKSFQDGNRLAPINTHLLMMVNELVMKPLLDLTAACTYIDNITSTVDTMHRVVEVLNDPNLTEADTFAKLTALKFIHPAEEYVSRSHEYTSPKVPVNKAVGGHIAELIHPAPAPVIDINGFPVLFRDFRTLVAVNFKNTWAAQDPDKFMKYLQELISRYYLDRCKFVHTFYETLQLMNSSNEYVTVDISRKQVYVTCNKFVEDTIKLFQSTKNIAYQYFHTVINKDLWKIITDRNKGATDNIGSITWIEDKINTIILDNADGPKNNLLSHLSMKLTNILAYLTKSYKSNHRLVHLHTMLAPLGAADAPVAVAAGEAGFDLLTGLSAIQIARAHLPIIAVDAVVTEAQMMHHDLMLYHTQSPGYSILPKGRDLEAGTVDIYDGVTNKSTLTAGIVINIAEKPMVNGTLATLHEPKSTLTVQAYPAHAIGFPMDYATIKEVTLADPTKIDTVQVSKPNYFNFIQEIVYMPIQGIKQLQVIASEEHNPLFSDTPTGLFSFVTNKSSKTILNAAAGKPFDPTILDENLGQSFSTIYHNSTGFNARSPHSFVVIFNNMLATIINTFMCSPHDKLYESIYTILMTNFASELRNPAGGLQNTLLYDNVEMKRQMDGAPDAAAFGASRRWNQSIVNNVGETARRIMKYTMNAENYRVYLSKGFYTKPLIPEYLSNIVLSNTLVRLLMQIKEAKSTAGDLPLFLTSSITESPIYCREYIKATMPLLQQYIKAFRNHITLFKKLFDLLPYQLDSVHRQFIGDIGVTVYDDEFRDGEEATHTHKITDHQTESHGLPGYLALFKASTDVVKNNINSRVDKIMSCLSALNDEFGRIAPMLHDDTPIIGEMYHDYNMEQKIIPPSLVSITYQPISYDWGLNDTNPVATSQSALLPVHQVNDARTLLQYGLRGFVKEAYNLEKTQIVEFVKRYNATSRHQLDQKMIMDHLTVAMRLTHFLGLQINTIHSLFKLYSLNEFYATTSISKAPAYESLVEKYIRTTTIKPIFLQRTPGDIIRILETKSRLEQLTEWLSPFQINEITQNREYLQDLNIIDLNIQLLQPGVFSLDIPYYYISKHSADFNHFIDSTKPRVILGGGKVTQSPHELFNKFMKNPFMDISYDEYSILIKQIMRGNVGYKDLKMPKYLTSGVYSTALFGDILAAEDKFMEDPYGHGKHILSDLRNPAEYTEDKLPSMIYNLMLDIYNNHHQHWHFIDAKADADITGFRFITTPTADNAAYCKSAKNYISRALFGVCDDAAAIIEESPVTTIRAEANPVWIEAITATNTPNDSIVMKILQDRDGMTLSKIINMVNEHFGINKFLRYIYSTSVYEYFTNLILYICNMTILLTSEEVKKDLFKYILKEKGEHSSKELPSIITTYFSYLLFSLDNNTFKLPFSGFNYENQLINAIVNSLIPPDQFAALVKNIRETLLYQKQILPNEAIFMQQPIYQEYAGTLSGIIPVVGDAGAPVVVNGYYRYIQLIRSKRDALMSEDKPNSGYTTHISIAAINDDGSKLQFDDGARVYFRNQRASLSGKLLYGAINRFWLIYHMNVPIMIADKNPPSTAMNVGLIVDDQTAPDSIDIVPNDVKIPTWIRSAHKIAQYGDPTYDAYKAIVVNYNNVTNAERVILDLRTEERYVETWNGFIVHMANGFVKASSISFENPAHAPVFIRNTRVSYYLAHHIQAPTITAVDSNDVAGHPALATLKITNINSPIKFKEVLPVVYPYRSIFNAYDDTFKGKFELGDRNDARVNTLYNDIRGQDNYKKIYIELAAGWINELLTDTTRTQLSEFADAASKVNTHYTTGKVSHVRDQTFDKRLWFYNNKNELKSIQIDSATKRYLQKIGYIRFNTVPLRLIMWLIHIQRIIFSEIRDQVEHYDESYNISGTELLNPDIFEEEL